MSGDGANSLSKGATGSCRFGGIRICTCKGSEIEDLGGTEIASQGCRRKLKAQSFH